MYRVDSEALGKCEYVQLTNKQYASVLVVDIDLPGGAGGHPVNLPEQVKQKFSQLIAHYLGPAWVGINPVNGKCQAIWLIDPVYADASGQSRAMTLLAAATHDLGQWLRGMIVIFPIVSAGHRFIPAIPQQPIGGIASITVSTGWEIFLQGCVR